MWVLPQLPTTMSPHLLALLFLVKPNRSRKALYTPRTYSSSHSRTGWGGLEPFEREYKLPYLLGRAFHWRKIHLLYIRGIYAKLRIIQWNWVRQECQDRLEKVLHRECSSHEIHCHGVWLVQVIQKWIRQVLPQNARCKACTPWGVWWSTVRCRNLDWMGLWPDDSRGFQVPCRARKHHCLKASIVASNQCWACWTDLVGGSFKCSLLFPSSISSLRKRKEEEQTVCYFRQLP